MCLELTAPANGQIEYNTDQTPDFDFGTVATYHCDRGYGISGGNGVRMCGGDVSSFVGLWSGIDPSCERKEYIIISYIIKIFVAHPCVCPTKNGLLFFNITLVT